MAAARIRSRSANGVEERDGGWKGAGEVAEMGEETWRWGEEVREAGLERGGSCEGRDRGARGLASED